MRITQLTILLSAASLLGGGPADADESVISEKARFVVDEVASGLSHPWGLAFLPDGRMLVTEKPGRLRIISRDGKVGPAIAGVPKVDSRGQGGLLDVAIDPDFATNRLVYLTFSEPGGIRQEFYRGDAGAAVRKRQRARRADHHFFAEAEGDEHRPLWLKAGF